MDAILKGLGACLLVLLPMLGLQVNQDKPEIKKIGPDVSASIVIYFNKGTDEEQIRQFYSTEIYEPENERGKSHKEGVGMVYRLLPAQANDYEAVAITFSLDSKPKQQAKIKTSIQANALVYKIFENIAPNDIKIGSEQDEVIAVVVDYWKYAESGNFDKAKELTTANWKGFGAKLENSDPPEKWINSYGLHYLSSKISEESLDEKIVIRVKALRSNGSEVNLFHDVVKTEHGWKILSTSY